MAGSAETWKGEPIGAVLPTPEQMVEARNHLGATSRKRVMEQIQAARTFLQAQGEAEGKRKKGRKRKG